MLQIISIPQSSPAFTNNTFPDVELATAMVSEKTKVKAREWAKRLECPVDDNANYENTYVSRIHFQTHPTRDQLLILNSGAIAI